MQRGKVKGSNLLYLASDSDSVSPLSGKSGVVFDALEQRFAEGKMHFGQTLSPTEIAEEFGVSQQPVRAALGQLRSLGYVIITPQVGCRVASPTPDEISDFFFLFGRMEGVMAALAADRHEPEEVDQLDAIGNQLHACVESSPGYGIPDNYARLVGDWHRIIRHMARSDALAWRLHSFWQMSDFLLWQGAPRTAQTNLMLANRQRESIRDALAARDSQTVEHLMAAHLRGKPSRAHVSPDTQIEQGGGSKEAQS